MQRRRCKTDAKLRLCGSVARTQRCAHRVPGRVLQALTGLYVAFGAGKPMRILITDGNERAALAAARSLVHAGHRVFVTAPTVLSLAGVSRHVSARAVRIDPLADPAAYVGELRKIVEQDLIDILLPITDASVEAILERRHALPQSVVVPFPDLSSYRAASDKAAILALAQACGFAVPETRVLDSAKQCEDEIPADFFPAVVKPHRSLITAATTRYKLTVTQVADVAELRKAVGTLRPSAFPVLVQRRIAGVGEGLFVLRWGGQTVALFAHRRLREKPLTGGVSVYRESIALDEQLVGPGLRLLNAFGWEGVAMIECKREVETGRYFLMEINGRFWGSLQLAIDAGVDFPVLLIRSVAGDQGLISHDYRIGVRSRWFWGDVDHLYLRLRDGNGSRMTAVRDFLSSFIRRDRGEIWRWNDPLPFALETLQWLRALTPGTGGAKSRSRAVPTESAPDSAVL